MTLLASRRQLLGFFAAPAIIKATNLMKVAAWKPPGPQLTFAAPGWLMCNGAEVSASEFPELCATLTDRLMGYAGRLSFKVPDLGFSYSHVPACQGVPLIWGINAVPGKHSVGMIIPIRQTLSA